MIGEPIFYKIHSHQVEQFLSLSFYSNPPWSSARAHHFKHAIRLLRQVENSQENIKRVAMASAPRRASLLIQLLIFNVRVNMLQKAGKWIRNQTQRKTKVQKLTKKSSKKDDDFFDIGTEAVEEQGTYFKNKEDDGFCLSKGLVGKLFCGKKTKLKFKRNTVTPSEGPHAWTERSGKRKGKERGSHSLKLFGSRSTKASSIKSDFDKPYHKNADARKLN